MKMKFEIEKESNSDILVDSIWESLSNGYELVLINDKNDTVCYLCIDCSTPRIILAFYSDGEIFVYPFESENILQIIKDENIYTFKTAKSILTIKED